MDVAIATRRWMNENKALVGLFICTAVFLVAALSLQENMTRALSGLASLPLVYAALAATTMTAAATGLGAVPVLFTRQISARANDGMLGFAAGVMLAASMFSLILPAISAGVEMTGSKVAGGLITAAGIALGGSLLLIMDRVLPHEHAVQGRHGIHAGISRVWLFIFAITLHNLPEGLAVGVAFAGDGAIGIPVALGIALQNMPEGLAVALAMLTLRYTPRQAALMALATGLVEPVGGALGAGAIAVSSALLPWGLSFAAGAMIFVVSHEIIPETHRNGHETGATIGLFIGFIAMMLFDTLLA